jgi:hypothetical protein
MTDSVRIFDPGFRVTDANGAIVSEAIVKVFDAGGTTPRTVYSNSGLSASLGTEVDCNAGGAPTSDGNNPCLIYTGNTPYRVRLCDSSGTLIPGMDFDNISGALDTSDFLTDADVAPDFPITNTSSAVNPVAADKGHFWNINCSGGDVNVTFPATTTLGNGWNAKFRHDGTANQILFVANGAELFKIGSHAGVAGFAATQRGQVYTITCDGTGFKVEQTAPALFNTTGVILIADRLSTPPSAEAGARYLVGSAPAGAWSTFAQHDIAEYSGSAWFKITPATNSGWIAYVADEFRHYSHDSTNGWRLLVNGQGGMEFITGGAISVAARLDLTIPTDVDELEIILWNIIPVTDTQIFQMRFSQAASFLSGASDYAHCRLTDGTATADQADTLIELTNAAGNQANERFTLSVRVFKPNAASTIKTATWQGGGRMGDAVTHVLTGFGELIANSNAIDGVRFQFASGDISSGSYAVMGRRYS